MHQPPPDSYYQSTIESLFKNGVETRYAKNQVIIRPRDDLKRAFLITSGFVKVYGVTKYGNTNLMFMFKSGETIPMPGIVSVYDVEYFYEAMSQVTVKMVPIAAIQNQMNANAAVPVALLNQFIKITALFANRIHSLELRTVQERMASFLLLLADRFGVDQGHEVLLNVPATHQDIADSISTSRETVTRLLSDLLHRGVIEQRNRLIVIRDRCPLLVELGEA